MNQTREALRVEPLRGVLSAERDSGREPGAGKCEVDVNFSQASIRYLERIWEVLL